MTATSKDKNHNHNQNVRVLEGIRSEKAIISGHAARRTDIQCAYMLPTLTRMIEKKPTLRILDVGCGAGAITVDFALKAPESQVIGLDLSGAVLETARVHAESKGARNVTFIKGDAHKLPFEDGSFDVVHTHQSVAHFANHGVAIKEMMRVTRKGGVLCMREGDLKSGKFESDSTLLDECFELIMAVHKSNGGDTDAGAKMVKWAVEAGVPTASITASQSTCAYDTLEERRDYGGHWPARCTYGAFAGLAMELGTTR